VGKDVSNPCAKCTIQNTETKPRVVHIAQDPSVPVFIPKEEKTTGKNNTTTDKKTSLFQKRKNKKIFKKTIDKSKE
jgi:hypothetical protein